MKSPPAAVLLLVSGAALAWSSGCAAPLRTGVQSPAGEPSPEGPQPGTSRASYCTAQFQSQFGWDDPGKAARVCQCESDGNPQARSRNGLYMGLFQFSADAWRGLGGGDPFDPWVNSHHAHKLWSKKGWRPWPHCGRK